jgi:hypothetical protein
MASITTMIKDNHLFDLGEKLNNMLALKEARELNYGYAGLEGIYINENILGLLEVLSEKIQTVRGKKSSEIASVVCEQQEIYKDIMNGTPTGKIGIVTKLLPPEYMDENGDFIPGSPVFIQDNEFYYQVMDLKDIMKAANPQLGKNDYEHTSTDLFDNFLRKTQTLKINSTNKGLIQDINDSKKNWINNYDYNKIFNKREPPIKSILAPYLADSSFKNFYLFFVTSNNVKEGSGGAPDIDTCSKQIQLMYDTRHFMDIIANENSKGIGQCNA